MFPLFSHLFAVKSMKNKVLVVQLCPTLRPNGLLFTKLLCPWNSPGKNTGLGYQVLLQGIFPTQGLNLGLPHCRQILYHLSHQGSSKGYGGLFKGFYFILRSVGSHLKQEGDMIKTVFKASLVVEWRMDWREARSTHEVSLQMAVAVFQPVMPTSALGLMAVDMEGQEDLRSLWKTESMGMGDMEDEEGKMRLLLG